MSHARIEPAHSCLSVNYNETATDIINCNPGKRNKEILDFMDKVLGIAQKPKICTTRLGQSRKKT